MLWVFLAFAAAVAWAVTNIADRIIHEKFITSSVLTVVVLSIFEFALITPLFAVIDFGSFTAHSVLLLIASGALGLLATVFYFQAIVASEVSRVIPAFQFIPIFTLVFSSLFFKEFLTEDQGIAFVVIFVGVVFLSIERSEQLKIRLSRAFWLAMLSSAFFALANVVLDAARAELPDTLTTFVGAEIAMFILILFYLLFAPTHLKGTVQEFRTIRGEKTLWYFLSVVMSITGYLLFITALPLAPISLIAVLGGVQPFFVFLFALILASIAPKLLREQVSFRIILVKLVALIVVSAGTYLLFLG